MRTIPKNGDIVVRQGTQGGKRVYALHIVPGPAQYCLDSGEEAVAHALTMAKQRHVRAWFATDDDAGEFAPLGSLFGAPHGGDFELETDAAVPECEHRLQALVDRLRAEYSEMPGLTLTPRQVQRLCGVQGTVCQFVLDALIDENFLRVNRDDIYARAADGRHPRPATPYRRAGPGHSKRAS
jgi:hypothetical protein